MSNRLGELLVREQRISLEQLREARTKQTKENVSLGYALTKMGAISDDEITQFLSKQYQVQPINLNEYVIDKDILKLVSADVCMRHKIIPVSRAGGSLIVAMADPANLHAIDDIKFLTGYNVETGCRFRSCHPSFDRTLLRWSRDLVRRDHGGLRGRRYRSRGLRR